ncbi:MAG: hypothetical protein HQM16_09400 [Deltaproteobacteria bacterium]|nr:hypothetical protein [Deltaproteobacteria bacterium]
MTISSRVTIDQMADEVYAFYLANKDDYYGAKYTRGEIKKVIVDYINEPRLDKNSNLFTDADTIVGKDPAWPLEKVSTPEGLKELMELTESTVSIAEQWRYEQFYCQDYYYAMGRTREPLTITDSTKRTLLCDFFASNWEKYFPLKPDNNPTATPVVDVLTVEDGDTLIRKSQWDTAVTYGASRLVALDAFETLESITVIKKGTKDEISKLTAPAKVNAEYCSSDNHCMALVTIPNDKVSRQSDGLMSAINSSLRDSNPDLAAKLDKAELKTALKPALDAITMALGDFSKQLLKDIVAYAKSKKTIFGNEPSYAAEYTDGKVNKSNSSLEILDYYGRDLNWDTVGNDVLAKYLSDEKYGLLRYVQNEGSRYYQNNLSAIRDKLKPLHDPQYQLTQEESNTVTEQFLSIVPDPRKTYDKQTVKQFAKDWTGQFNQQDRTFLNLFLLFIGSGQTTPRYPNFRNDVITQAANQALETGRGIFASPIVADATRAFYQFQIRKLNE